MVDHAAGVENDGIADLAIGAHDHAGGDDDVASDGGVVGDGSGGVNRGDQADAALLDGSGEPAPGAVIADRDDNSLNIKRLRDLGQVVDAPQYRHTVDAAAVNVRVRVEEPDDLVLARLEQDVQHDAAVTAGAEDQDTRHVMEWELRHSTELYRRRDGRRRTAGAGRAKAAFARAAHRPISIARSPITCRVVAR